MRFSRCCATLARAGKTIVCVLHDLNDAAAYADRIALLGCGKLLALEPPDAVLASDLLERTYGASTWSASGSPTAGYASSLRERA